MIKSGSLTRFNKVITNEEELIKYLKGFIPLENKNIKGLNLYFDAESFPLTCDGKSYCMGIGLGNSRYKHTPLKSLPKPSDLSQERGNFYQTVTYRRTVAKKILEINQAIESGKYNLILEGWDGGLGIASFSIINRKGIEEKLI